MTIELDFTHPTNPSITHVALVKVDKDDVWLQFSDGEQPIGSPFSVQVVDLYDEETETWTEPTEAEILAALEAAVNRPDPEPSLKSAMYAAWKALDDEVRDPFIPYWPAVNLAIDIGDTPEAIRILNAITVPAELEGVRQGFMSMLS